MDENRFGKLKYPVARLEPKEELKVHPEFKTLFKYPEFSDFAKENPDKLLFRNRIIRYICFLYDPESDLISEFPDLLERKEAAAIEAGLKRSKGGDGDWPGIIKGIFDYSDQEFIKMVLRFLKQFPARNYLWREISTLEMEYEKYTRMRWEKDDDTKAGQLIKTCDEIRKNLKELYKEFTQGDKELEEQVKLEMVTPENVGRLFKRSDVLSN